MKTHVYVRRTIAVMMMGATALLAFHDADAQGISLDSIRKVVRPMPLPAYRAPTDSVQNPHGAVIYNPDRREEIHLPAASTPAQGMGGVQAGYMGTLENEWEEMGTIESFTDLVPANTVGSIVTYPTSTIVKLLMGYDSGGGQMQWFTCSGTMVASNVVLTAGHCVYERDQSLGWPDEVRVMPAYEYGPSPMFGTAYGTQYRSYQGWTSGGSWDWDMAYILLDQSIGYTTGWLGYAYYGNSNDYFGKTIHNFSYPSAPPFDGEVMFYQTGTWDFGTGTHLIYSYDPGYGGMSGSSGYYKEVNGNRYVMGILSHGDGAIPTTGFVKFDQQKFNDLQSYIQTVGISLGESPDKFVVAVYPNPAQNTVHLSTSDAALKIKGIELYDCAGKLMRKAELSGSPQMGLDVGDLPNGMYTVRIFTQQGAFAQKLAIKRD